MDMIWSWECLTSTLDPAAVDVALRTWWVLVMAALGKLLDLKLRGLFQPKEF